MEIENGVILYTIGSDGCLNGLYANKGAKGEVFNEVAKKITDMSTIEGKYECFYFEEGAGVPCNLLIDRNSDGYFEMIWSIGTKPIFKGVGYLMNSTQIVVNYWDV